MRQQRSSTRTRWVARFTALGVVSALGAAGLTPSSGLTAEAAAGPCWENVFSDVDGGGPDVVVGLPGYDLPGKRDAGAIAIFSDIGTVDSSEPRPPRTSTLVTADQIPGLSSQAGARFGAAVSTWRDGPGPDPCVDLLVGAPGQTVGGLVGAGRVYRLEGAPGGLAGVLDTFDEASLPGSGGAQAGAEFGASLGIESSSLIAVGAPGRDVAGADQAGRVARLDYTVSPTPAVTYVRQGGDAGSPEAGDRFGEVLDVVPSGVGPLLFIGVPGEDVGSLRDAGAVALSTRAGALSQITQDSSGAGGIAEAGDRYGAALTTFVTFTTHPVVRVVIGVPGEDVGRRTDAGSLSLGAVDLFAESETSVSPLAGMALTLDQNSPGVPGAVESGDAYGAAVLAGEFGRDGGQTDLVVGAPRENVGSSVDAGAIGRNEVEGDGTDVSGRAAASWTQNSPGTPGKVERGDRFGSTLTSLRLDRPVDDDDDAWAITVTTAPGEDVRGVTDAGVAYVGVAPGDDAVALVPPVLQAGAGLGMVPMRLG